MKSEFEFIKSIQAASARNWHRAQFNTRREESRIRVGIGDDCAVIPKDSRTDLVITTDMLVEDIDFRLDWSRPDFIGRKALAVSLSDIAAMGAKPAWALISIGVPARIWDSDFVENFYSGWFALAKDFKVELAGGDVSRTPDKIVIDSIVAGEVKKNRAVLRSGAEVGDLIFVSGKLGGAAAGLRLLEKGVRCETAANWQQSLLMKQLNPSIYFKSQTLSEKKLATAMIDLSDGLSSDLAHLCAASNVGAKIYAEKIPVYGRLRAVSEFKPDALRLALDGGEDFQLLFTVKPKNLTKLKNNLPGVFHIGEITENVGKIELVSDFESILLEAKGFRHF